MMGSDKGLAGLHREDEIFSEIFVLPLHYPPTSVMWKVF